MTNDKSEPVLKSRSGCKDCEILGESLTESQFLMDKMMALCKQADVENQKLRKYLDDNIETIKLAKQIIRESRESSIDLN